MCTEDGTIKKMKSEKLKLDKNFMPCPVSDGDELFQNGIFLFNITKIIEHIRSHPEEFIPESILTKDFDRHDYSIDEDHVDSVGCSKPVILAEIAPEQYSLIDGHHRMAKIKKAGMENIMAYKLSVLQHINFLTTQKAYVAYVEYWNSKF